MKEREKEMAAGFGISVEVLVLWSVSDQEVPFHCMANLQTAGESFLCRLKLCELRNMADVAC